MIYGRINYTAVLHDFFLIAVSDSKNRLQDGLNQYRLTRRALKCDSPIFSPPDTGVHAVLKDRIVASGSVVGLLVHHTFG